MQVTISTSAAMVEIPKSEGPSDSVCNCDDANENLASITKLTTSTFLPLSHRVML
jgi:hypothetical protein